MKKILLTALTAAICIFCQAKPQTELNIIPQPKSVSLAKGSLKVRGANFNYDATLDELTVKAIGRLAEDLYICSGKPSSMATAVGVGKDTPIEKLKGIFFFKDGSLAAEQYTIEVGKKAAKVCASTMNGFLYALSTLRQIMPEAIFAGKTAEGVKWTIPCCTIKDEPRFAYRGLMLDCARHFYSVDEVKRYLDIAAFYKINRFHWHLTEDQGWRIEIKKYPKLTEVGAFRSGTQQTYDKTKNDGKRYGGYYTQEQIREVVEYASTLGITTIPELDLPGHMLAAMASYPWLGCAGGPYQVWTRWGVSDQVLCVGKEETFTFLQDVLDEICELFPSEYIHIGGDECPKTEWSKCPVCQAKIAQLGLKDGNGATKEQRLQNYVTARIQKYLAGKGRKVIGWDEILEGELAEGATVMSWRGTTGGIKASQMGYDVIMSPTTYCYLDYNQGPGSGEFLGAGYTKKGKNYDAANLYSFEPLADIPESAAKHILGVQANMWTEYIRNERQLHYMLNPRLQALSEVQWCTPENKDYTRFESKMKAKHFKILDTLGYIYRPID
ncbi:MAG: beta-N-acetylhexosaminidase [Bacteroidales bacterium]|nr:beta-N-acetylhexosaminidase [Bacteroidales bacterium]